MYKYSRFLSINELHDKTDYNHAARLIKTE